MVFRIFFSILFCFSLSAALAQVTLSIYNSQNHEPLASATVIKNSGQGHFVSDSLGSVNITSGSGVYEIRHIGFLAKRIRIESSKSHVEAFMEPDFMVLESVEIKGFENDQSILSVAGGYSLVNQSTIKRFNNESLVRAINTTPGVRMEERSPSSYRLSIRGSLLRAPFGVRNVKVYWNEIPYTDPTGNSYLYFIDNQNVDRIEIVKGPAGSAFGAGMGGVMTMSSGVRNKKGLQGNVGYSMGSFGYHKIFAGISYGDETSNTRVKFAKQKYDGYRKHTQSDRNVLQLQHKIDYSEKASLDIHVLYSDLFYELPGGLTNEQYREDPRQARKVSVDQDAYVDHQNFLLGISHQINWNKKTGNTTVMYVSNGDKENPFITNYEYERLSGIGGRTKFYHFGKLWNNELQIVGGGEFQYGNFHANNHDNNAGYSGALRFEDESRIYQGFVFAQADYTSASQWIVTLGGSLNFLSYHIDRLKEVATDSSYRFDRNFQPVFSPRISLLKKINERITLHGSVSAGFSSPTQEEIRTSDGSINENLEPETGINYEIGVRGNSPDDRWIYDITAFFMAQKNTIVSRIEAGGNSRFKNAGNTSQKGIELLVGYNIINKPGGAIDQLEVKLAYTFHDFVFKNYIKEAGGENVDYSGNALTGTAPHIVNLNVLLGFGKGFYLNANYNYTDGIPLNDANTVFSDSYHLVNVKLGWERAGKTGVNLHVGTDNLLNERYSLGNDLNAFGGRYYEPSPIRNYYVGIEIDF